MSQNVTLSRKQLKAISALLSTQTIADAARHAGVSARTLQRWLADDDFRRAMMSAASESISGAVRRLAAGQDDALDTIYELMCDGMSENVRRLAARDWLSVLRQAHELEIIEQRLSQLESEVYRGRHKQTYR